MDKFYLPEDAVKYFRQAVGQGRKAAEGMAAKRFDAYKKAFPNEAAELEQIIAASCRKTGRRTCRSGSRQISRLRRAWPAARR